MILKYYSIFRPGKTLLIISGFFTIPVYSCGSIMHLDKPGATETMTPGIASLFLVVCAGYLVNDRRDIEFDPVNGPARAYAGRNPYRGKIFQTAGLI
ncbi:MAG: hypothetical protein MUD12_10275 [Spirochaetes bacterium]|nr:hypothetical protein [Spirochaetota bacterium]